MAKKKKEVELKEVSRTEINGAIIIKYEDGSVKIIPAPIMLSAEEAEDLFGSESDDEEEEEEEESDDDDDDDDDSEEEEEEEELTGEELAEMDFEELEDVCDDKDLETDPDDFDEDDIEKLRKAIAKELGLKLPAKKEAKGKGKKGKKYKVYHCPHSVAQKHKTYTRSEKKLETYMLNHIEEKIQLDVLRAEGRVKAGGNDAEKRKKKLSSELGRINKMFEKGRITEEYYDERYEAISKELKELSQTAATEELETKKKIQSRFPDGWKDMYMQLGEQDKQVFWKSIVKEIKISPDTYVEDIIFF